jgi:hypothetical protein
MGNRHTGDALRERHTGETLRETHGRGDMETDTQLGSNPKQTHRRDITGNARARRLGNRHTAGILRETHGRGVKETDTQAMH